MQRPEQFEIVALKKGGHSLRSIVHGETFHPGIGPMEEARILHVDQQKIVQRARETDKFILWDVGLGAAANAIAAIEALFPETSSVEIHSFDKTIDPLLFALNNASTLTYILPHQELVKQLVQKGSVTVRENLNWHFHAGDFCESMNNPQLPLPHSVFYDPYSPSGNVEMWTLDHFKNLFHRLGKDRPFLLTNYTRSTAVRVTLLLAGFQVGKGVIIGEKAETTIASNDPDLLDSPLDKDWLAKVWISRNGAPIKPQYFRNNLSPSLILPEEMAQLESLPQFTSLLSR